MRRLSELLWLGLGLYLTVHYAWLMDDAFVYFRYVDNWVIHDRGLVYNPGEWVEGYSSPLWALLLGLVRATGTDWWTIVRGLGLVGFALTWFAARRVQRRLAPSGPAVGLPLLYFALAYGPLSHFTSGLETPLVQALAAVTAWFLVEPRSRAAQVLVGLAPLVRPELITAVAVAAGVVWALRGRAPRWTLGTLALTSGGWLLARLLLYASWLPNTFALKHDLWLAQGLRYLRDAGMPYHVPALLAATAVTLAVLRRRRRGDLGLDVRIGMLLAAFPVALYVVRIGGDFVHYRLLAYPLGLTVCAMTGTPELLLAGTRPQWRAGLTVAVTAGLAGLFFTARPTQMSGLPYVIATYPYLPDGEPRGTVRLREGIEDPMVHRWHPDLTLDPWQRGGPDDPFPASASARSTASRRAPVAEFWCASAYRQWDTPVVQSLGLTDPILAHVDVRSHRPGHKWLLEPLARQLAELRGRYGDGPDMLRSMVEDPEAPAWILRHLESVETLLQRAHNRHGFAQNLQLAFRSVEPIRLTFEEARWARRSIRAESDADPP